MKRERTRDAQTCTSLRRPRLQDLTVRGRAVCPPNRLSDCAPNNLNDRQSFSFRLRKLCLTNRTGKNCRSVARNVADSPAGTRRPRVAETGAVPGHFPSVRIHQPTSKPAQSIHSEAPELKRTCTVIRLARQFDSARLFARRFLLNFRPFRTRGSGQCPAKTQELDSGKFGSSLVYCTAESVFSNLAA